MSSAPPYQETTIPLTNLQTVPRTSEQHPAYPNQNVPGQYQHSPLLKQEASPQPVPPGAFNAAPRTYQQPFWSGPSGSDRKMIYIIVGIIAGIVILGLVLFLVIFFTIFNKVSSVLDDASHRFEEAEREHDEFERKNFPNNNHW